MRISLKEMALEIRELKEQLALYDAECKLIRKGNSIEVHTSNIVLARSLSRRGYEVYVA